MPNPRRFYRRSVKPTQPAVNTDTTHEPGCMRQFGLPCTIEGKHTAGCRIMGPRRPHTIEAARRYARGQIDGRNQAFIEAVAQHMATWGGCVWHACAELLGKACACAGCTDPRHYLHAWCRDSAKIYAEGPYRKLTVKHADTWTVEIDQSEADRAFDRRQERGCQ